MVPKPFKDVSFSRTSSLDTLALVLFARPVSMCQMMPDVMLSIKKCQNVGFTPIGLLSLVHSVLLYTDFTS